MSTKKEKKSPIEENRTKSYHSMMSPGYESFLKAFKQLTLVHGQQAKISREVDVTAKYINDILAGRKLASHKLQEKISSALGLTYEEMLALGRRLISGEISSTSPSFVPKPNIDLPSLATGSTSQLANDESFRLPEMVTMTMAILESNTVYRPALAANIKAFYAAATSEPPSGSPIIPVMQASEDEPFSLPEMVTMTMAVLESNTIYRPALAANVRAFYTAVEQEKQMRKVEQELKEMRKEIAGLKELILSRDEVIAEKKLLAS